MATAAEYAQWITANQDKVGTPDFLTVANAYRQAKLSEGLTSSNDNYSANPTEGMSGTEKFLAGAGKGMTDIARGIGQVAGLVDQQAIDEAKKRDLALMDTGAGIAGNIAGGAAVMAPAALIPGVNSALGATLLGTASGALSPVASDESRLSKTVIGGAAGLAGNLASRGLARVLNPQTSKAVTELMDEGVTPTPGQILGGTAKKLESGLESIPVLGSGIAGAKDNVVQQFNKAAINRALAPIGEEATAIGHEGMRQAREAIEKSYDDALSLIPDAQIDQQFASAISQIRNAAAGLIPDRARQFENILDNEIVSRIGGQQQISGDLLKSIESQVKSEAAKLVKTPGYDEQKMGQALNAAAQEIRDLVARNSPEAADALKKADAAYASLLRLERAATTPADGVFSPNQLGAAIRGMDGSLRKKAIAQGEGLMQDLANNGREVLGGNLANSGTADRALLAAVLAGKGTTGQAVSTLATAGLYTQPGQKMLAALLAKRPDSLRTAGDLVRRAAPYTALTAAQAANQ